MWNISLVFIIVVVSCLCGCSCRLNKFYDYEVAKIERNGYLLTATLNGRFKSKKNITVKGSPYKIIISVQDKGKMFNGIEVSGVRIFSQKDNHLAYENIESVKSDFSLDSDGSLRARVFIDGVELGHHNYLLKFNLKIKSNNLLNEENFNLPMKKIYHEYKSNDLVDKILSA
jgi:hypothetical protein